MLLVVLGRDPARLSRTRALAPNLYRDLYSGLGRILDIQYLAHPYAILFGVDGTLYLGTRFFCGAAVIRVGWSHALVLTTLDAGRRPFYRPPNLE